MRVYLCSVYLLEIITKRILLEWKKLKIHFSFILRELLRKCITKRNDSVGSTRRGGGPRKGISCSNYYRCRRWQMFASLKRSPLKALNPLILFLSNRWKTHKESTPFRCIARTNATYTENKCMLSWIIECQDFRHPALYSDPFKTLKLNIKNLNVTLIYTFYTYLYT